MSPDERKSRREDAHCSDIRDTCVVGGALRRRESESAAIAEALDERLFRGHRPSMKPLTRDQAVAEILALHCDKHRPRAVMLLAEIGAPPTRPPNESGETSAP